MEIDINKFSCAHIKGGSEIIKCFDNPDECLKFCEKANKEYGANLAADPIYVIINNAKFEGFKKYNQKVYK